MLETVIYLLFGLVVVQTVAIVLLAYRPSALPLKPKAEAQAVNPTAGQPKQPVAYHGLAGTQMVQPKGGAK